jgi:putative inorganic carbon (hco3(-)) transporter
MFAEIVRRRNVRRVLVTLPATAVGGAAAALNPVLAVIPLAVTGFIAIAAHPELLAVLLLLVLPFNDLVAQVAPGPIATSYGVAKDLVLLLLVVTALGRTTVSKPAMPGGSLAAFGVLLLAALVASVQVETPTQALYGIRASYEPILLVFVLPIVMNETWRRRALRVVLLVGQVAAVVALVSWSRGLDWLLTTRIDPQAVQFSTFFATGSATPRAFSPFVGPNELGASMLIIIAIAWWYPTLRRGTRVALSVLPIVAVILSQSRSAQVGLIALVWLGIAVRFYFATRRRNGGLVLAMSLIAAIVSAALILTIGQSVFKIGPNDLSSVGHLDSIIRSISVAVDHPLGLGPGVVGPRAFVFTATPVLAESFFLVVLLESGFIAAGAFLVILVVTVRQLWSSVLEVGRPDDALAFSGLALMAAVLPNLLFLPSLQDAGFGWLYWCCLGLCLPSLLPDVGRATPQVSGQF